MENHPHELQSPETEDLNLPDRTDPLANGSVEPPQQRPSQQSASHSTWPQESMGEYLRNKDSDYVLSDKILWINSCHRTLVLLLVYLN